VLKDLAVAKKKIENDGDIHSLRLKLARSSFNEDVKSLNKSSLKRGNVEVRCLDASDSPLIIGFELPFPLQFLFSSRVMPLGVCMELAGERMSCKSLFTYELGRIFCDNGGWMELINTESKYSQTLAMSILGYDRPYAINAQMINDMSLWQKALKTRAESIIDGMVSGDKANGIPAGATYPVLLAVDSIAGASLSETNARIDKDGSAGRAFPLEALSLTNYLKYLAGQISPYPITGLFVNHLKIKPGENMYQPAEERTPGGTHVKFQVSLIVYMYRKAKSTHLDPSPSGSGTIERRQIQFKIAKSSIGADNRKMSAWVSWCHRKGEDGNMRQITRWQWNEATTRLLCDFQKGKLYPSTKLSESTWRTKMDDYFHFRDLGRGNFCSDSLGVPSSDPLTASEIGKLINDTPEAMSSLRLLFGIHDNCLWEPGEDFEKIRKAASLYKDDDFINNALGNSFDEETVNILDDV
jgi:hypothetical protein